MKVRPTALALLLASTTTAAADRIAVMSAFEPEWIALRDAVANPETRTINGNRFVTGTLEGQEVVLFLSGISMVNATMTTQLALDHFDIEAIVFSGIAGGVDPSLSIGDVVVPAQWGGYLNAILARETAEGYAIPPWMTSDFAPLGMIYTRTEAVQSARAEAPEEKFWYAVDPNLLATAEAIEVELPACDAEGTCLSRSPRIVTGGNGVSGAAFVDNAEVREWAFDTFDAQVLDMESAAVAQVAYANEVPFIAFRSLSDLAGGGEGANEMGTFLSIAAGNSASVVRAFLDALD